ncbi:hypothetical protein BH10BDE1_BH10BDE1_29250 [soil metagenome]
MAADLEGQDSKLNSGKSDLRNPFRSKRVFTFLLVTLFVFVFIAWKFLAEYRVIARTPLDAWTRDQRADCAVVLTGGSGRVKEGMDLLARRAIRKLIVSGVNPQADWREIFPNWPYYQDVEETDIVLERKSRTTFGNAQQTLAVAEALHCRDLLLITSRFHLHRALRTFRAEFEDRMPVEGRAVPAPTSDVPAVEIATESGKSLFYSLWAY